MRHQRGSEQEPELSGGGSGTRRFGRKEGSTQKPGDVQEPRDAQAARLGVRTGRGRRTEGGSEAAPSNPRALTFREHGREQQQVAMWRTSSYKGGGHSISQPPRASATKIANPPNPKPRATRLV